MRIKHCLQLDDALRMMAAAKEEAIRIAQNWLNAQGLEEIDARQFADMIEAAYNELKEELSRMTGKEIYVDIIEIKTPETDAQLVAENVALQLERRVSFRRAMKKALQTAKDLYVDGLAGRETGLALAASTK